MERGEMLFTVAGLLATFLLPWPNGEDPPRAAVQGNVVDVREERCAVPMARVDAPPHCDALPVRARPSPPAKAKRT